MKPRLLIAILLLAIPLAAQQPSPRDLFERARILDESNRNLDEAVALYGQVAAQSTDRELSADAQLRAGLIFERLGRPADAQRTFASILTRYPEQGNVVRRAQARLATLAPSGRAEANGAVARRVWAGADVSYTAAASPNGQFLTAQDMTTGDLVMREISTGRTRRVTAMKEAWAEFALGSVISPDNTRVAYTWAVMGRQDVVYELRTSDIAGGEPKVLYRNPEDSYVAPAAWMPDGSAVLATIARKDLTTQIALISTRTGAVRVLKTMDWQSPGGLSVSPDGRWIAFNALPNATAESNDLFLLDFEGTREVVLDSHAANDTAPIWTPDGSGVVFLSNRSGAVSLWLVPVEDGKPVGDPRLLKSDLGRRIFPLGVSAAGAYFYAVQSGGGDIAVVSLDPRSSAATVAPVVVSERFVGTHRWPAWSPDGSSLAYLSDRGQMGRVVVIRSMQTGRERDITLPRGYSARVPRWSPDGLSLVFVGSDDRGRPGLYVLNIDTGHVTAMVRNSPGLQVDWVDWMPGGREVVYGARDDPAGGSRLVRRNVSTGEEQELHHTDRLLRALAVSPDGRQIVVESAGVLYLTSTSPGPLRELFRATPGRGGIPNWNSLAWTHDGGYVLFPYRTSPEAPTGLSRVAVASGVAEPTGFSWPGLTDAALGSDGRLAFVNGSRTFEVWALENFLPAAQQRLR